MKKKTKKTTQHQSLNEKKVFVKTHKKHLQ